MTEYILSGELMSVILDTIKTAYENDVPEIVRCRDCKHYDARDAGCSYFVLAKNKLIHIGNPNGFCSWGERREL